MSSIPKYFKKIDLTRILIVLIPAILFIAAFIYIDYYNQTRIVFFDIGQGDSIFISSGSNQVLIDGGPDKTVLSKLSKYMPIYDRTIETVVLTHPHSDHLDGLLEVIKRYQIGQVIMTKVDYESDVYSYFIKLLENKDIPTKMPCENLVFGYPGIIIQTIYPTQDISIDEYSDLNDTSIVQLVILKDQKILLTGDINEQTEQLIIERYGNLLKSDILKVPHHGSITSSSQEFIDQVKPNISIISFGPNDFGLPSKRIINRLNRSQTDLYSTYQNGDLIF